MEPAMDPTYDNNIMEIESLNVYKFEEDGN